jgi:sugar lactone lactonase YvrE
MSAGAQAPAADAGAANGAEEMDVYRASMRAAAAEKAGDAAGYRRAVERVAQLAPGHPAARFMSARAMAMTGDTAGAIAALAPVAPLGAATDVGADSAFRAMKGSPEFMRLAKLTAENAAPIVRSDTAFGLGDPDLIPESVAYDPLYSTFYAGSLGQNRIVRIAPSKVVTEFVTLGKPGAGRVVGIKVDEKRRMLWAATYTFDSSAAAGRSGDRLRVALDVFDLATSRRLRHIEPADRGRAHFFNDLALAPDGSAYLTDMEGDAVLRVRSRRDGAPGDTLEPLPRAEGRFTYPNGLDLSPDGRRLYVAHTEGISVWDLFAKEGGRALEYPTSATTAGVDGLYACAKSLVVVQRVLGFDQVARLRLDGSGRRVTEATPLERRHPGEPQHAPQPPERPRHRLHLARGTESRKERVSPGGDGVNGNIDSVDPVDSV